MNTYQFVFLGPYKMSQSPIKFPHPPLFWDKPTPGFVLLKLIVMVVRKMMVEESNDELPEPQNAPHSHTHTLCCS